MADGLQHGIGPHSWERSSVICAVSLHSNVLPVKWPFESPTGGRLQSSSSSSEHSGIAYWRRSMPRRGGWRCLNRQGVCVALLRYDGQGMGAERSGGWFSWREAQSLVGLNLAVCLWRSPHIILSMRSVLACRRDVLAYAQPVARRMPLLIMPRFSA